jgi:hypothetical protein
LNFFENVRTIFKDLIFTCSTPSRATTDANEWDHSHKLVPDDTTNLCNVNCYCFFSFHIDSKPPYIELTIKYCNNYSSSHTSAPSSTSRVCSSGGCWDCCWCCAATRPPTLVSTVCRICCLSRLCCCCCCSCRASCCCCCCSARSSCQDSGISLFLYNMR